MSTRRKKVKAENRRRVAEACERCKYGHQKCDSFYPCQRCQRRQLDCIKPSMLQEDNSPGPSPGVSNSSQDLDILETDGSLTGDSPTYCPLPKEFPDRFRLNQGSSASSDGGDSFNPTNRAYRIHIESRILKDPREPLFVGPGSTWSFLQSIRLAVDHGDHTTNESIASFTEDEYRFIMEEPPAPEIPPDATIPSRPPAIEKRQELAHIFFTKTAGMVEILDREHFTHFLAKPQDSKVDLCSFYLVLAIGLLLSKTTPETSRGMLLSASQVYFQSAKACYDPTRQLDGPSSLAVTPLCLMAFHNMMLSRWKTSYRYIGMAVRFANSLGLHQDSVVIDDGVSRTLKHNLWKTLFVLESLISNILGLPTSLEKSHLTEGLDAGHLSSEGETKLNAVTSMFDTCQSINEIIEDVYHKKVVRADVAIGLLDQSSKRDKQRLGSRLDPQTMPQVDLQNSASEEAIASIINLDVIESFSVSLLTRPFFYNCVFKGKATWKTDESLRNLAEACVASSNRTISALYFCSKSSLGIQNPLLLHFCFTAAIALLSNEYFGVFDNTDYYRMMDWIKHIFDASHLSDVHTKSLVRVIRVFAELVESSRYPQPFRQRSLPNLESTGPSHDARGTDEHNVGFKRIAPATMPNAPHDSRALMVSQLAGAGREPNYQPWPATPHIAQAPHEHVPQHHRDTFPSVFLEPTGNPSAPSYAAYAQYPALEGLGPQVSAGAPHTDVYSNESQDPSDAYWHP